jgi:hypothetical protein
MCALRRVGAVVQRRAEKNQQIDASFAAIKFYGVIYSALPPFSVGAF